MTLRQRHPRERDQKHIDYVNKLPCCVALTEIATQLNWHGEKLTPDDWKILFMDALTREMRNVPSLDGSGVVNLGRSSSNLSKAEFSDLIELIHQFGANHGVVFHDPEVVS